MKQPGDVKRMEAAQHVLQEGDSEDDSDAETNKVASNKKDKAALQKSNATGSS